MHSDPANPAADDASELATARKREAALREILGLISRSRDDERPMFDAILRRAADLCGAEAAALVLGKAGDSVQRLAGHFGLAPDSVGVYARGEVSMDPDVSIAARAILSGAAIHIPDMIDTDGYRNGVGHYVTAVHDTGVRSQLFVPLLTAHGATGCILVNRKELRPFTPDEIALVETFAAQAVIAIENVRQFRELQDALEQQQATSDILRVISQSREDETKVFDLILERAAVLCDADQGSLMILNEARTHVRHMADWGHDRTAYLPGSEYSLDLPLSIVPTIRTAKVVHIEDYSQSDAYKNGDPIAVDLVETEGHRTRLVVPLLQNGIAIGCIALSRRAVRSFTPDEIALVETFAAQAVIAIENVRQFRELQTRLAREAATREILEVISQSRDDDKPVFDVVLRKAADLCNTPMASLFIISEDRSHAVIAADLGLGESVGTIKVGTTVFPMDSGFAISTCMREGRIVHLDDMADTDLYRSGDPIRTAAVDEDGLRTLLAVPLFGVGRTVGCISVYRREVKPFSPDEIALVETFAAQAVIAIENVRQFRELQIRLEREAATREILEVISHSRDDDRPVFDVVLRKAAELCNASMADLNIISEDRTHAVLAADWGDIHSDTLPVGTVWPMDSEGVLQVCLREGRVEHLHDLADTDAYRSGKAVPVIAVDEIGIRTILAVPMFSAGRTVACISIYRREVRPFTPDEIALVETFAAQAVIAIENVRQFKALEALNAELGDRVQAQVGEIERMGRLKRFLPSAVADAVVTSGSERMLSSHRALLGVLFCDIRGFTAFCETAEPEETIEVLQTYHEEMGRLIEAHGAGVDHRMGDGIMVLFNDPLPCDDPAGAAVGLAMAMRDRMAALCARWKKMGHRLGFGVGISLGYATFGMVGSGGRQDYTASGTAVNLAARLCDEAIDGEILVSPRAATAVEGSYAVEGRGERNLKGIREPVELFRVMGLAGVG